MRNLDPFFHALPVSPRSLRSPLYLTNLGWEHIGPREEYPQIKPAIYFFSWNEGRSLPEFCLALCAEGSGTLETKSGRQLVRAGEAFLYEPGEWHRHRPVYAEGWTLLWIGFNGDLPYQWMNDGAYSLEGNKPVIEDRSLFEAQFERLLRTGHRNPTRNSAELSWQAIGLLSHFLIDHAPEPTARERGLKDVVTLAIEFIWNHTHAALDVSDIVQHVGCSRRTLETRFKETTGRTLLEEIQFCRADRARHLLESTDLPIKQVVYRSGFQSREQMRLALRRALGKAPRDLRKRD